MAILSRFIKRPANLGVTDGKLAPCPNSPNCVSTQSDDPRHQIEVITYEGSSEKAQDTLADIIRTMERTEIIHEEPGYILAEFRTKGMGYVDDVEFSIDAEAKIIHFRSSARLPYSDWGVNRNRMEQIRSLFNSAIRE
ncbi:MAG: DUF1499 domain-containing protein [Anaerolineae bacterium]|nr:DUF1499 domain-containing protein [Anaerolineae bacterium]